MNEMSKTMMKFGSDFNMNLNDFFSAMYLCGRVVDYTWEEEDRNGINPLNSVSAIPMFIGEEIKKQIPIASASSVVICRHLKVSYKKYGPVSQFKKAGFKLQNYKAAPAKPFTPDISVTTNGTISYIEIKKIKPLTKINKIYQPTYPVIFAPSGTTHSLISNNYGSSAIFSSPANGDLMTFFHEGQIFNDIARLLKFRINKEQLFFGAYIFSTPGSININDIDARIDAILKAFNGAVISGNAEVLSELYGYLNSWPASQIQYSTRTAYYGSRKGYDIYGVAFEIH